MIHRPLISMGVLLWLAGCASVEFTPTRRVDFDLSPELSRSIEGIDLRPWDQDPPRELDSRFHVYYALEIADLAGIDQWLVRIVPAADRITNLSRFQPEESRRRSETDNRTMMHGLLRGFTAEFGPHSDLWIEDLREAAHDFDLGMTSASVVQVYVDTIGPIRRGSPGSPTPSQELLRWSRSKRAIPVVPQFFAADFPSACAGARELVATSPGAVSSEWRHEVLSAVVRGKMKLAQGMFMIMGSPALKKIADRVMEQPSLLAYASMLARYVGSSESGFVEWIGSFAGIRFDTASPSTDDPDIVQFRFEPRLATTVLLKTEISGAGTDRSPLASAGFVTIEGINPYDAERNFKLRLLGWNRDPTPGQLLTTDATDFRFSPDGRSFATGDGDRLWLTPDDTTRYPRSMSSPGWSRGNWSHDGRRYYALATRRCRLEVVDLDADSTPYESIDLPPFELADAPVPSPTGSTIAYTVRDGTRGVVRIVSMGERQVIETLAGYTVAEDGFSHDGRWLALRTDPEGERALVSIRRDSARLADLAAPVTVAAGDFAGTPRAAALRVQWEVDGIEATRPRLGTVDGTPPVLSLGPVDRSPQRGAFEWYAIDPNGRWVIGGERSEEKVGGARLLPVAAAAAVTEVSDGN